MPPLTPKKGKGLQGIAEALGKAHGQKVDVGFFAEQGLHPTAKSSSGKPMTFVELAKYHATGGGGKVPVRDILTAAQLSFTEKDLGKVVKAIDNWLEDPRQDIEKVLMDKVGKVFAESMKNTFGTTFLHPTGSNPDPLIDSGELMKHTAYKTKNGPIKEV